MNQLIKNQHVRKYQQTVENLPVYKLSDSPSPSKQLNDSPNQLLGRAELISILNYWIYCQIVWSVVTGCVLRARVKGLKSRARVILENLLGLMWHWGYRNRSAEKIKRNQVALLIIHSGIILDLVRGVFSRGSLLLSFLRRRFRQVYMRFLPSRDLSWKSSFREPSWLFHRKTPIFTR
jgi:hypothetical protein